MPKALIVHGGAWNLPDSFVEPSLEGVRVATAAGWELLRQGRSALDAVEAVLRILEDDPHFDAGRGSRLNRDGRVELDASIMEGEHLRAGAVAAIQGVRHPVSVARLVMERTPHVMLAGQGARRFAASAGAELCSVDDLLVGRELERYRRVRAGDASLVDDEFGGRRGNAGDRGAGDGENDRPMGTVGAVALDESGLLAAGTSTGGVQDKLAGRVGDTPVIGAGTYADNLAGAGSATGWGEGILRVSLTKAAVDLLGEGRSPREAGKAALALLDRVDGKAGLILMDPRGGVAAVFNTPRMTRAWVAPDGTIEARVEPTEEP